MLHRVDYNVTDQMPQHSVKRRILVGTGWLTAWRMLSRLLGFISILVLTQLLAPSDFGLVILASSVAAATEALSQVGVRDALVRLRDDTVSHYDTAFTIQVARGVITGGVIIALGSLSSDMFGEPRLQNVLYILGTLSILSGFENIGIVKLSRELRFGRQIYLQAAPRFIGFITTVSLAFWLRSYWALIWGLVLTRLLGVLITYSIMPHMPRFSLQSWRYFAHFSFWSWAGSIALVVWTRSDPFLLSSVLGSALLGIYVVSNEVAILPVTELIEPASGALYSGFALAHRTDGGRSGAALVVATALSLIMMPFSAGISACSGYLVAALLNVQWEAAQPTIAATAFLCMFSPFSYISGAVLSAQGYVKRAFFCNAAAAATKIIVVLAVRDTHSLPLIALANVGVVALEAVFFIQQIVHVGNPGFKDAAVTMARATLALLVTCAVLYLLPSTWGPIQIDRFSAILIGSLIGILSFTVFFTCLALLWFFAGRPSGAEAAMVDLATKTWREFASYVLLKWRRV